MFETYLKYCDTLYQSFEENAGDLEKIKMIKRLNSTKSPCLDWEDHILWFSTFTCSQIVTDTYERPVILFSYVNYMSKDTVEMRETHEAQVFPFEHMDLANTDKPITLLLSANYF